MPEYHYQPNTWFPVCWEPPPNEMRMDKFPARDRLLLLVEGVPDRWTEGSWVKISNVPPEQHFVIQVGNFYHGRKVTHWMIPEFSESGN